MQKPKDEDFILSLMNNKETVVIPKELKISREDYTYYQEGIPFDDFVNDIKGRDLVVDFACSCCPNLDVEIIDGPQKGRFMTVPWGWIEVIEDSHIKDVEDLLDHWK